MSTTIDNRVVEMRFDNKQFESATAQSMSTIDKLKQKLKFSDSSKGLENLGTAAKKVDMTTLGNSVETVRARFSALQIMGVTALANITNQAVNAGKRIASALTIDPIKTGFQEYETQINSVQTILANTQHAGTTIDDVTKALDQLNTYADKTIYNFTEMTRNIGTFTAAGIDLDTSVNAIQGIANLAAVSGSSSQQASTAMYQLSQALAAGTVKLMDWNSVVNAGMGGKVFQDALTETARVHGIAIDDIIKKQGSFRESLSEGWITSDILTETLEKFTMSTEGLTEAEIELARQTWKTRGYTEEQIDAIFKLGDTATNAATKVKTFTQLWDVLKESAQSGWAKTWQLIIGDFEEAKTVWTSVSDVLTGFINKMNDARNKLLESALGMGFDKLKKSLQTALGPIEKVVDSTKNVTKTIDDLGKIVDEVIIGKFGNGQERYDKLTKAGKNYYRIQNEVNKTLGDGFRFTEEKIAAQDKLLSSQQKTTEETEKAEQATGKLTDAQKKQIKEIAKLSEEQMRSAGYTDDQIAAFKELKKTAKDLGLPLDELIDNLDEINGRWLLLRSFANIGETIGKVWSSVAGAFRDVFGYMKPETLFDMISGFHRLTSQMIMSDETADKLQRTFRGLFSVIDIISRIAGSGLRIALTIVSGVLKAFGKTTLDVTAGIGDLLYEFDQWLKKNDFITEFIEKVADKLPPLVDKLKEFGESLWIDSGMADNFHKIADGIESIWNVLHGKISLGLNSAMKIIGSVFKLFGTSLGEVLAKLADWVSGIVNWIDQNTLWMNGISKIAEIISKVITGIGDCIKAFMQLEPVQKLIENIKNALSKLGDVFDFKFNGNGLQSLLDWVINTFAKIEEKIKSLGDSDTFQVGLNIIEGLIQGISSGIGKAVSIMQDLGARIIDAIKSVLGIHSPSTVMIAIGSFIILGLITGLLNGWGSLWDTVKTTASNIVNIITDAFQNGLPFVVDVVKNVGTKLFEAFQEWDIDFGSLVVVGTIIGLFVTLNKITKILDKVTSPLEKFGGLLDSAKDAIDRFGVKTGVDKFAIIAKSILNIGIAIGILAASFYMLSKLDWPAIGRGTVAIIAISGALTLLALAASKMETVEFGKLAVFMLGFSASILLLSYSMKILAGINAKGAEVAVKSLIAIMLGMSVVLAVFGTFIKNEDVAKRAGKVGKLFTKMAIAILVMAAAIKIISGIPQSDIDKSINVIAGFALLFGTFIILSSVAEHASGAGSMILKMAIAIAILPIVIKMIAGIPNGDIIKGLFVIAAIELLFAGIVAVSKFAGKHASKAGSMLLKMSFAIGILAMTMKLIATMSYDDIAKGLVCIAGVEALFAAFILVSRLAKNDGNKAGSMIFKMAAGMALMGLAIKIIASTPMGDIIKGLAVIAAIEILFGAMVVLSSLAGPNVDKAGGMMLKMSAAILILVGAIAIMSLLDPKDIAVGTAAIVAMLTSFALIGVAVGKIGNCTTQLIIIAATIALLVGAIIGLTFIDKDKVATASAALSAVIGMLAILVVATKYAGKVDKSIFILVGVVGALGGVLYLLSGLPVESTLSTAASLSILLLSLAGALKIMSSVVGISKSALIGIAALTGIITALAIILGLMAYFEVEASIETAISLGILLNAMATALVILGTVKAVSGSAIGAMYIISGIVAILAIVLGVMSALDVEPSIETATALSILLLAMAGVTAILAAVGLDAPAAIAGAGAFAGVVAIIGSLMVALGALVKYVPAVEDFLERGISVLEQIGQGIGRFVGGIVAGLAEGALSGLPQIGALLSAFMVNAMPFINGAKLIDDTVLKGVGILALAIGALVAANLLENITSFLSLGSSFSSLGSELSQFVLNAMPFITTVSTFTPEMFEGVKSLTSAILQLTAASFLEGITRFLGFGSSLSEFGAQLPTLGTGLRGFINALGPFSEEQVTSVKCAGQAIKALAQAGNEIDGQAEWAKKLFGDNSLATFSAQLPVVALSLKSFVANLGTFTDDQVTSVKCAAKVIKALADAGSEINGQGEWAKALFGDNSLSAFTADLPIVALSLRSFVSNLGVFTEDQVASVKCAGNAIKALASAGSNIDGQADWAKKLFGDNGLGAFSDQLPVVAKNLKSFISNLGTFGEENIATTNAAVGVVKALAKLGNSDLSNLATYLPLVGEKMIGFADDLASFCDKMSDVSSAGIADKINGLVKSVSSAAKKIGQKKTEFSKAGTSLINALGSGIDQKKKSITTKFTNAVTSAKKGITDKKKEFTSAGKTLGGALVDGFDEKKDAAKKAGGSLADKAKSGAREKREDFVKAGKYLGQGLIDGINAKKQAAYDAGFALGKKSAQGVKDGSKEKSPSKLTYQYGIWQGEGLINGITSMVKKAYGAGYDLGDTAARSMSDAISKISDLLNTDMDTQPTITPVLDLSNVESGVGAIDGMFGFTPSVGVMSRLGNINTAMNRRNQNGLNDDVVSAIDKLGKSLGGIGGNTYNINGINYEEGSDVAEALSTIVRAARVERRI